MSYATPAYYADRLCERGRCYLRSIYSPNANDKSKWRETKKRAEKAVAVARAALNPNPPARPRGYRKTQADYDIEREDADDVRNRDITDFRPHYEELFKGNSSENK